MKGSRNLHLEFLDPLRISRTAENRSFEFVTQTGHKDYSRPKMLLPTTTNATAWVV